MAVLIGLVVVVVLIALAVNYWPVTLVLALIVIAVAVLPKFIRGIRKNRYFASEEFLALKGEVASVVAEHNEIVAYVSEMRDGGSFQIGASETGNNAHLATFQNTSTFNYRRDRNLADYDTPNVHNCSLQVVRNAAADPIKYVMKYFDIKADEGRLAQVESLSESISRLEDAVNNLREREASITQSIHPPPFVLKYFEDEFMAQVGVVLSPVDVPYPEYVFEYVSAGGNSSQRAL